MGEFAQRRILDCLFNASQKSANLSSSSVRFAQPSLHPGDKSVFDIPLSSKTGTSVNVEHQLMKR